MGSFFILNLFIGVIIENFNRLKQQVSFSTAATFLPLKCNERQFSWLKYLREILFMFILLLKSFDS